MRYALFIVLLLVSAFFLVSCSISAQSSQDTPKKTVTIYKFPTCGCCEGYAAAMKKQGYAVTVIKVGDMDSIKQEFNIPRAMESCHTTVIDGYVFEGHIPLDVVQKVLDERPDIQGIALPDMPSGTPGMPGPKREKWLIYALSDGNISEYVSV